MKKTLVLNLMRNNAANDTALFAKGTGQCKDDSLLPTHQAD